MNEEKQIHKYIDEKKELYNLVIQIIDKSEGEDDTIFQKLTIFLDTQEYENNKPELKHFLYLISNISINHHRGPDFFNNVEKILKISFKFYNPIFSNEELFMIFQQSKPILLFLLKSKIIIIDQIIFQYLANYYECIEGKINYYFYPELNSIIRSGTIKNINEKNFKMKLNGNIENFEINRQKFENESNLCSIIREDLIEDFVQYFHKTNISLSCQIKRSLFETNSMLIEKDPTLIEYAAFFGSIQIIKYIELNKVELKSSLWLYAVHSNNPEVIEFLEEKQIEMDDRTFLEAIKCHHNDIANYILSNRTKYNFINMLSIYSSSNYEFFPDDLDGNDIFFSLCINGYYEIITLYLSLKKEKIDKYIREQNLIEPQEIIQQALEENKLDVVYNILLSFDYIPYNYFRYFENMTKIALPNTIKVISDFAFYWCSKLIQISIPNSVTSIGPYAFSICSSLTQIIIPSSVASIGPCVFSKCSSLTQISIPSSVTSIGDYTFFECLSLTQIIIPSSVTSIGDYAFFECLSLTQIIIPSSVTSIGNNAFSGCSSLTQISIPSSITSIGNYAFSLCSSLTQITIPSSVTSIGDYAFFECLSLTQIIIPSSITSIGNYAFGGCSSLTQIIIPSSVTSIGNYSFFEYSSLNRITIHSSNISMGVCAFRRCSSLTQIIQFHHL